MPGKTRYTLVNIADYRRQIRLKFNKTGVPFVTLKYAQTLDGKIATTAGDSKWISSLPSRRLAHRLRGIHRAVLVGVNTVIQDDPQLSVRLVKGKNPIRIVVDTRLRSPFRARVFRPTKGTETILATTSKADKNRIKAFEKKNADILLLKANRSGQVDLKDLLQKLGQKNIQSVLVEGGSKIITSFLKEKLVDRMIVVIAPLIVGKGLRSVKNLGREKIKEPVSFSSLEVYNSGSDLILDGLISK